MSRKKALFMETTEIPAYRTSAEILALLVQAGAKEVLQQYDSGKLVGLKFTMDVKRGKNTETAIFQLPARVDPVFKMINGRRKEPWLHTEADKAQAERTAWRQLYRWVQAQLALIENGMVEPGEVFLPYAQAQDGRTFWEVVSAGGRLALPPAEEDVSNVKQFEKRGAE